MNIKSLSTIILALFLVFSCEKESVFDQGLNAEETSLKSTALQETSFKGSIVSEQIYSHSLEGNLLGDPALRNVNIYLPPSYNSHPNKHFPVIYFLHGMPAWGNMLIDPVPFEVFYSLAGLALPVDFPENGFVNWVNDLIATENMKEAIIVMPDARTLYGPGIYLNSEVAGNYEDYIVKDLVPFIDSRYRTIPQFNWRAITGHCAGGYGALNIAMRHPHVFRYVGALSPAYFTEAHFTQIAIYSAYEEMIWQQQGAPAGPLPYVPTEPLKFMTNTAYLLCQFWLPNPENSPYYCDLPYTYVDGQPQIDPDLMAKIDAQNLLAQTHQYEKGLRQLKTVYFDCGTNDELYMFPINQMLHQQLTSMHIKHQFEAYEGTHISNLYDRLGQVWTILSNEFPERN